MNIQYHVSLNDSAELHLPYDAVYGSAADEPAPTCRLRAVRVCAAARTADKCETKRDQYKVSVYLSLSILPVD